MLYNNTCTLLFILSGNKEALDKILGEKKSTDKDKAKPKVKAETRKHPTKDGKKYVHY